MHEALTEGDSMLLTQALAQGRKLRQLARAGSGGGWMESVALVWKGASCQLALGQGGKNPWNMAVFQLPSRWGFSSKRQGPHQELGMEGLAGQAWFPVSSGRARVGEGDTLGT